jgi:hypothetical protein
MFFVNVAHKISIYPQKMIRLNLKHTKNYDKKISKMLGLYRKVLG